MTRSESSANPGRGSARYDDATATFEQHRKLLHAVVYRILGRVADTEDVLQDTWLRWVNADRPSVLNPRAYLVRIATHLAVDRLRRVQACHESYVGPWLPEPLLTGDDASDSAELADSVSLAMLVVLESLSPLERAVFVLREAFSYRYAEIADIVGRTETAVRQVARRARDHVQERAPRYDTDRRLRQEATERFLAACAGDDLAGLMALLAPDVALIADGGGVAKAPRRVIHGADKVARFLLGIAGEAPQDLQVEFAEVNAGPAIVATSRGAVDSVFTVDLADGLIQTVRLFANPDKLRGLHPSTR